MQLSDYLELWRMARRRSQSENDYRTFQMCQARLLSEYLAAKGVQIQDRVLLDLGSGVAGYSFEFSRRGARVLSVDLVHLGAALSSVTHVCASAEAAPFSESSVDVVFCASLIEHVAHPESVLAETYRVLRPGGFAYFSFPPFYSPMGGHEYAPFHYLGEKTALRVVQHSRVLPNWVSNMHSAAEKPDSFAKLYKGWGLYRMTIRRFGDMVQHSAFVCRNISTRYWPVSFVRWPIIGEILTWHAQFLLQKPTAA
jgi:ubiquinone/menaquinone biosynthesis C-methylase UbiE